MQILDHYNVHGELEALENYLASPIYTNQFNADQYTMDVDHFVRTHVIEKLSQDQGKMLDKEIARVRCNPNAEFIFCCFVPAEFLIPPLLSTRHVQLVSEKPRLSAKLPEKQDEYDAAVARYESSVNSVREKLTLVRGWVGVVLMLCLSFCRLLCVLFFCSTIWLFLLLADDG